jgi:hypothetical protein
MGLVEDFAKFLEGSNRMISDPLGEAEKKIANMSAEDKEKLKKKIASGKDKNPKKTGEGLADGGGSKPDFLDLDKDGNKTEPMKQAAKQKVTAKGGVRTAIAKIKKAKDGSRTGVRGTGAAKRGFRKARLS